MRILSRSGLLALVVFASACAAARADAFAPPKDVADVLKHRCLTCHQGDSAEGNARFDTLAELDQEAAIDLLNRAQEQLYFRRMPPEDAPQPSDAARQTLAAWFSRELNKFGGSKLEEKLRKPEYGNYIDHDQLFSGDYRHLPGFTDNRRWLISEFIFNETINRLLDHQGIRTIDGKRTIVRGDNGVNLGTQFGGGSLRQSITNPFLLPATVGVRYYDNTMLSGGHLLTMISNARKIAAHMVSERSMKARFPAMYRLMERELAHQQTLRSRQRFLEDHIERLLQDISGEQHEALLPEFVRMEIEEPPDHTDGKGNPIKKTNLELLARYDAEDMAAIYQGIARHADQELPFSQIVESCEREWAKFGVHEKRLRTRLAIMKVLGRQWDLALIYGEARKRKIQPPAYEPLSDAEMSIINTSLRKHRKQGDTYRQVIDKCLREWSRSTPNADDASHQPGDALLRDLVTELFAKIYERQPTAEELPETIALIRTYLERLESQAALAKLIESLLLSSELVYRTEFGHGEADAHGRRMMSPRDASYALAYALTDSSPDDALVAAAESGQLNTREDYRREVIRMLNRRDQFYIIDETVQKNGFNSSITNMPIRKLRFFREFFGYPKALTIFKDDARFGAGRYDSVKGRLVDEADMLVDQILQRDTDVFEALLTTENFYVYHSGNNESMKAASARIRKIYDYFKEYDWENFTEEELYAHWDFIKEMKMRGTVFPDFETDAKRRKDWVRSFKTQMRSFTFRLANGQTAAAPYDSFSMHYRHKGNASTRTGMQMRGPEVGVFFNIDFAHWDYPTTQPAPIPNRKGMLTHPAWLIAHALNTENDPVRRGKWVREKLLAGTIPDVPITVDAVVPEDHHKTLRQRLTLATGGEYCWKCHQQMNPLGLAFEIYDDFGRFRTRERLEHPDNLLKPAPRERGIDIDGRPEYKTLPVNAAGFLAGTGDDTLDGEVRDAMELAERLARAPRVRQSIIRHAFRYFMGRNERLSDSKTLIDADNAYLTSGGSFDAVIVSLLTSDSFIYRKAPDSDTSPP